MTDDSFEMPDLGDLSKQIEDAMKDAQNAMDDLPNVKGLGGIMGSLSSLMENMPDQMGDLTDAISGFGESHEENANVLIGEPDWGLEAEIRVGSILHLIVSAEFDLGKLMETWESTQGAGFEEIVGGVVSDADIDLEDGMLGQIMGQLKQGRGAARVTGIDVVSCHIQGAPGNASDALKMSPEGNIPLVLSESGIGFEFAPMLTIKNRWENAAIPTFLPMAEEIVVPVSYFDEKTCENVDFKPTNQDVEIELSLRFSPIS